MLTAELQSVSHAITTLKEPDAKVTALTGAEQKAASKVTGTASDKNRGSQ